MGQSIQNAKKKKYQRRTAIPNKTVLFKSKEEIKMVPDKQKLKEFVTISLPSQEILKRVLQGEIKGHQTVTQSFMEK